MYLLGIIGYFICAGIGMYLDLAKDFKGAPVYFMLGVIGGLLFMFFASQG